MDRKVKRTNKRQIKTCVDQPIVLEKKPNLQDDPLDPSAIIDRVINIISVEKCNDVKKIEKTSVLIQTEKKLLKHVPASKELNRECIRLSRKGPKQTFEEDKFLEECTKNLSTSFAKLVKMQVQLNEKHERKEEGGSNGSDWDFKLICLFLSSSNRETYNLLQNILYLPTASMLQSIRSGMDINTAIGKNSCKAMQLKFDSLPDEQKHCCVCISTLQVHGNLFYDLTHDRIVGFHDIDDIQRPILARTALIVAVRGLFGEWKQLVTLAFLEERPNFDTISLWIDKVIANLLQLGLKVRCLISDLTSDFMIAHRALAGNNNYFYVNKSKIYYISDPSILLVSFRDSLTKYDFYFDSMVAKWDHIVRYYEFDKSRTLRLTSELTEEHVKPISIENKYKVKYAAELLSANVAAAMSTYVDFNVIDGSAIGTVALVSKISKLYNILTSDKAKGKLSVLQDPISFFNEFLLFINSLQVVNPLYSNVVTVETKSVEAFKITVGSILMLHRDLEDDKLASLCFGKLSIDCFEELLDDCKASFIDGRVLCEGLHSSFRKNFISGIFKTEVKDSEYIDKILTGTEEVKILRDLIEKDEMQTFWMNLKSIDYDFLKLPCDNKLLYISGYLLKRAFQLHSLCEKFQRYLAQLANRTDKLDEFIYADFLNRESEDKLIYPPEDFVDLIKSMECLFVSYFRCDFIPNCEHAKGLYESFKHLILPSVCVCFPMTTLKKLYIHLRIHYTLLHNNEELNRNNGRPLDLILDIF